MKIKFPILKAFSSFESKISVSFTAILLLTIFVLLSYNIYLFNQVFEKEENRLLESLASTLSVSISKVSFAGKYQIRLFVDEIVNKKKEILYVSVESPEGEIISHNDAKYIGTRVTAEDLNESRKSLKSNLPVFSEHQFQKDLIVKEVVLPYYDTFSNEAIGMVRIGIDKAEVTRLKKTNQLKTMLLMLVLTFVGLIVERSCKQQI